MEREENAFNEIQHDISIVRFKKKGFGIHKYKCPLQKCDHTGSHWASLCCVLNLCPQRNQEATFTPALHPANPHSSVPSLPPGPCRSSISVTITPVIPPVDCQPRLRGLARQHRVMSYWSWHCLTPASIPLLMSLVSSAHNPCYQLRPQPIHYQSLAGECIGPLKLPATPTWGENLMIFPCSVSNFRAGGLWFIISLRRDWLIGAGALWVKAGELLCYWGRNKSIQSRLQDSHWLQHRLWRPIKWVYYKYHRVFFSNISKVTLRFTVFQ